MFARQRCSRAYGNRAPNTVFARLRYSRAYSIRVPTVFARRRYLRTCGIRTPTVFARLQYSRALIGKFEGDHPADGQDHPADGGGGSSPPAADFLASPSGILARVRIAVTEVLGLEQLGLPRKKVNFSRGNVAILELLLFRALKTSAILVISWS